jgi:hypothetical protein
MEDESIDHSVQLTPSQVKAYAEQRAKHGGVEYNEGRILVETSWFPDILLIAEVINTDHKFTCQQVYTAGTITMRRYGFRLHADMMAELHGRMAEEGLEADLFFHTIMLSIPKPQAYMIGRITLDGLDNRFLLWAREQKGHIQDSIESAQNVIANFDKYVNMRFTTKPYVYSESSSEKTRQ